MKQVIDSLNKPQKEAVTCTQGALLILAGAGTGKTRVLTARLAHIIRSGLASPGQVLAVTFTNKAAREMGDRTAHLVGMPVAGMWLGTFHSLAVRMIRRHVELCGLQPNFTILDTDDQLRLAKQVLTEAGVDEKRWPPRLFLNIIGNWKDNAWHPNDVPKNEDNFANGKGRELYAKYQQRLQQHNAADFGDLLLKAYSLLKNNAEILKYYQQLFKYVLVDEYQDTNTVQYLWLRLLVMAHKNICVVGDDDQSIYAWRGAKVGNILRFEVDFPGCTVVRLEQNYRSTGNILKAAAGLIAHNTERHEKTLWTEGEDGHKVEVQPVNDGKEEARVIANRINSELKDGKNYDDIAILVRTAAQTRPFEEQLIKEAIPYQVVGGLRFYERKEIRDAVAYLKLVYSPLDDFAFQRIVNVPKRGVGDSAIQQLTDISRERSCSLLQSAEWGLANGVIASRIANKLRPFVENIAAFAKLLDFTSPDNLMEKILEDSGYLDMWREDKNKEDAKTRIENLKELLRALQEYNDVTSFLEHVALVMDRDEKAEHTVTVTTVHAAKGLEFNTVFIPGFEEGLFPHQRSLNEEGEKGLEEERRLAYVAMTRAEEKLILTYTSSRLMYGQWAPSTPSRFLQEIPDACLEYKPTTSQWGAGYNSGYGSWGDGKSRYKQGSTRDNWSGDGDYGRSPEPLIAFEKTVETEATKKAKSSFNSNKTEYAIGLRVFHQKFGYGRIRGIDGSGADEKLQIAFDKAGVKKLLSSLANLEIV